MILSIILSIGYIRLENYHNNFLNLSNQNSLLISNIPLTKWKIVKINNYRDCCIMTFDSQYCLSISNSNNPILRSNKYKYNYRNNTFQYRYITENKIYIWNEYTPDNIGLSNLSSPSKMISHLILEIISSNNICTIISYNLGYNIVLNQIRGSEYKMVERCQQEYNGGWKIQKKLSQCSANAFDFLANSKADIIGLQEINMELWPYLKQYYNNLTNNKFEYFIGINTILGSNMDIMGKGIQVISEHFYIGEKDKRGMIAIFYPKYGYLIINIHMPHNMEIIDSINERINKYIESKIDGQLVKRIIIMGDFNDGKQEINSNTFISGFNKKIRLPKFPLPLTCCNDVNYIFSGDYILDSNLDLNIYFGIPPLYERHNPLISDHDPVILITKI